MSRNLFIDLEDEYGVEIEAATLVHKRDPETGEMGGFFLHLLVGDTIVEDLKRDPHATEYLENMPDKFKGADGKELHRFLGVPVHTNKVERLG